MNPIETIVPKIRQSAANLKYHHVFGMKPDLLMKMLQSRKAEKNFTCHVEAVITSNADGSEHIVTIELMKYDDPATVIDRDMNKSQKPSSEQIMLDAYNAGIDLINELMEEFEDDFDIMRENSFPFVKVNDCSTGYVFRLKFITSPDICL